MKYIVFSIDDGTVYDKQMTSLMNKYHIKGTFNLNSGLEDFVWYKNGLPIERLHIRENKNIYKGHEVCCHSLTHPHLDWENEERVNNEIYQDKQNLESIFGKPMLGFATPFDTYNEYIVEKIKGAGFSYIRLPYKTQSFIHEEDNFHLGINALTEDDDLFEVIDRFSACEAENAMCIIAGHSYEFYCNNSWSYLEDVFKYLNTKHDIDSVTTTEALKKLGRM